MIDILFCLAVFGITYIVRYTDGPFDIFFHFKRLIGLYIPEYEQIPIVASDDTGDIESCFVNYNKQIGWEESDDPDFFLARLVGCFACLSTWVALLSSVGYILLGFHQWNILPILWLGSTGLSIFLNEIIHG